VNLVRGQMLHQRGVFRGARGVADSLGADFQGGPDAVWAGALAGVGRCVQTRRRCGAEGLGGGLSAI
jgi:hypothetical protein